MKNNYSFNPCFYGSYSFTVEYKGTPFKDEGSFNPCFYGSYSFTSSLYVTAFFPNSVLILVFMEVILLPFIAVSISSFLAAF